MEFINFDTDAEMARRLQEEEDARLARQIDRAERMRYTTQRQPQPKQPQPTKTQGNRKGSGLFGSIFGSSSSKSSGTPKRRESQPETKQEPIPEPETPTRRGDGFNTYFRNQVCQAEMKHLQAHCPKGIYCLPSADDSKVWNGVAFVDEGPYDGGIFKFILQLPEDYPRKRPEVQFVSYISHPQVDADTGSINNYLCRELPNWDQRTHHVSSILDIVAKMLLLVDPNDPANTPVADLYVNNPKEFEAAAKKCVQQSIDERYDNQIGSGMEFAPYDESVHDQALTNMLNGRYDFKGGFLENASRRATDFFQNILADE
eukprot:comp5007_c0_seq1/m.1105 comp5007_c0_seq1/g.1105  ORF comp5007_c0_seq1/g.1105 comp5007_c0_seq1/m.1105 type:complete len:316 (-) comp5007_c0_seq1:514-1461(-)